MPKFLPVLLANNNKNLPLPILELYRKKTNNGLRSKSNFVSISKIHNFKERRNSPFNNQVFYPQYPDILLFTSGDEWKVHKQLRAHSA
jgi:hypothetical protein